MLKKLNQKNKKASFLIWMVSLFALALLTGDILFSYTGGTNLALNIFSTFSAYANSEAKFYGENVDMSQILPTSQHYIVNSKGQDLIDIAADLGINLFRITNIQRSFDNNADSIYTEDQWNEVLGKMQSKGIKAIILIEVASDNGDYYNPQIQPAYLHLVQEYIDSGVFSNSDIYAVDIKNEPMLTDANTEMLQAAHYMIKEKYPNLKQTIGSWATPKSLTDPYNANNYDWSNFSGGKKIASIVDFYSIHMYGFDDSFATTLGPDLKAKVFVSQVENGLQTKKPVLIEEFGEANGNAVSDQNTIGSPELQANVYQGVYQALKEMHSSQLIGAVAFDFYSRDQLPDAWAIVKNNGNYLFPAAYILQAYALGKNNPSIQQATIINSQSYLVTNTDNNSTKTLHVADRIGLKLQLDDHKNYSLSLSANGMLQPLELFQYDPVSNSYHAVYQAVNKGDAQLNIISNDNCKESLICTNSVYTLEINVQ